MDKKDLRIITGNNEANDPLVKAGWVVPGHPVWTRVALKRPFEYKPGKGKVVSPGSGGAA